MKASTSSNENGTPSDDKRCRMKYKKTYRNSRKTRNERKMTLMKANTDCEKDGSSKRPLASQEEIEEEKSVTS